MARTEQANAALAPVTVIETDTQTGESTEVEIPGELAARIFGRAPAVPSVSATPPPGWPAYGPPADYDVTAIGTPGETPDDPADPTLGLRHDPHPTADVAARHVIAQAAGAAADRVVGFEVPSNAVHGDVPYGVTVGGEPMQLTRLTNPPPPIYSPVSPPRGDTVPLSPGYDTDGEGNAIEDDEPGHWQCDTCGEEFETRAAFEGHESENTHPEEPDDPDDDPPAFPDALTATFERPMTAANHYDTACDDRDNCQIAEHHG